MGRFTRATCDMCSRGSVFIGYNRIPTPEARLRSSLTWTRDDYKDVQCGVFCTSHGKGWFADRRAEFSYSHRLIRIAK